MIGLLRNFPRKSEEKKIKIKTSLEETSYGTPPLNPNFHRLDPFFIFLNFFIFSEKSKNFALILFDF